MALDLGGLVAWVEANDGKWNAGLDRAERRLDTFEGDAVTTLNRVAGEFDRAGDEAGRGMADGVGAGLDEVVRGADGRLRDLRGKFVAEGDAAGRGFGDGVARGSGGLGSFVAALGNVAGGMGKAAAAAGPLALGFTGVAAALGGIGAVGGLAGGALATLPGIMLAGMAATQTFKIATDGLSEAFAAAGGDNAKALEKAMKDLSPAAQSLVREFIAAKPAIDGFKQGVQEAFTSELKGEITDLVGLLPMMKTEMSGIASVMGENARAFSGWLTSAEGSGAIQAILSGTRDLLDAMLPAVDDLARSFIRMGENMGPSMGAFGDAIANIMNTVSDAFDSLDAGQTEQLFGNMISLLNIIAPILGGVLGLLLQTFASPEVGAALDALLQLVTTVFSAILPIIGQLATAFAPVITMLAGALAPVIEQVGAALSGGLGQILPVLAQHFAAMAPVVGALVGALGTALVPIISTVAGFFAELIPIISPLIVMLGQTLAPIISTLGKVIATILGAALQALMPLFAALLPVLTQLIGSVLPPLVPIIELIGQLFLALMPILTPLIQLIANNLAQAIQFLTPLLTLVIQALGWLIGVLVQVIEPIAAFIGWIVQAVAGSASFAQVPEILGAAWEAIKSLFMTYIGWLVSFYTGLWDGIKAATSAAWEFIKGLFTTYLDGVKLVWGTIWNGIKAAIDLVWTGIKTTVNAGITFVKNAIDGLKIIVTWITDIVGKVKTAFTNGVNAWMEVIRGIQSKIQGVVSGAGSWLVNAGKQIIQGLINGIESMISSLKSKLSAVTNLIPNLKGPEDVDRVLLQPAGRMIMGGLISGIDGQVPALKSALSDVTALVGATPVPDLAASVGFRPLPTAGGPGVPGAGDVERYMSRIADAADRMAENASRPIKIGNETIYSAAESGRRSAERKGVVVG